MSKIKILQVADLPPKTAQDLTQAFDVVKLPKDKQAAKALLDEHGATIRGIAARKAVIDGLLLSTLPAVEIIACFSAGLDGIDSDAAKQRGIVVTNSSKVLAEDVADLAIALAVSTTRGIVRGHDFARRGDWPTGSLPLGRSLRGMNVGIVGFGHVGSEVAKRLDVIGAKIGYFDPFPKLVAYRQFPQMIDMATWAEMLVVTCPAMPATFHLINAAVLQALGPTGFLLNISRGTVVDQADLIAALRDNKIAGAALDVFETEPDIPEALRHDDRVVLSPHLGSATHETRQRMGDSMVDALTGHFAVPAHG